MQGSDEWLTNRMGLVTASRFKDACSTGEGRLTYLAELLAEIFGGLRKEVNAKQMDWGKEHEEAARQLYAFETGAELQEVDTILSEENPLVSCSPDSLVGTRGGIEIKCPWTTEQHIKCAMLNRIPPEHLYQIYGNLWVTGREWWDFVSYDPRLTGDLAFFRKRVEFDDKWIGKIRDGVNGFTNDLREYVEKYLGEELYG